MKWVLLATGCFFGVLVCIASAVFVANYFLKDWQGQIVLGREIAVTFNDTFNKFDDSNYSGDWRTDPMGAIKGGETYTLKYLSKAGWVASGFNQGLNAVSGYPDFPYPATCANPLKNELCLWGRVYDFTQDGEVFDRTFGHVGQLQRLF